MLKKILISIFVVVSLVLTNPTQLDHVKKVYVDENSLFVTGYTNCIVFSILKEDGRLVSIGVLTRVIQVRKV